MKPEQLHCLPDELIPLGDTTCKPRGTLSPCRSIDRLFLLLIGDDFALLALNHQCDG
jgi:hypothetical protein